MYGLPRQFRAAVWTQAKTIIRSAPMHSSLKIFSYVVILLMAIAMLYSGYISIKYWAGIGV
jgi:hypothetical protein